MILDMSFSFFIGVFLLIGSFYLIESFVCFYSWDNSLQADEREYVSFDWEVFSPFERRESRWSFETNTVSQADDYGGIHMTFVSHLNKEMGRIPPIIVVISSSDMMNQTNNLVFEDPFACSHTSPSQQTNLYEKRLLQRTISRTKKNQSKQNGHIFPARQSPCTDPPRALSFEKMTK